MPAESTEDGQGIRGGATGLAGIAGRLIVGLHGFMIIYPGCDILDR